MDEARFELTQEGKYKATYGGNTAVLDTLEQAAMWLEKEMYPGYHPDEEA